MNVSGYSATTKGIDVSIDFFDGQSLKFKVVAQPLAEVIRNSDIITLHVPAQKKPIIGEKEISQMKDGSVIINTARGGVVDEISILEAIEDGKLLGSALVVFDTEPTTSIKLLMIFYL